MEVLHLQVTKQGKSRLTKKQFYLKTNNHRPQTEIVQFWYDWSDYLNYINNAERHFPASLPSLVAIGFLHEGMMKKFVHLHLTPLIYVHGENKEFWNNW